MAFARVILPLFCYVLGMTAPDELPNDIAELKAIIRAQQDQNARLEALVASFKKALFGAKSEKIDPAQYELELEDIETAIAQVEAEIDADERTAPVRPLKLRQTNRGSLPKHLERVEIVIEPEPSCACGAERHVIGEDVSERLDIIPAKFRVIVTRRPKYACRSCEGGVTQAPGTRPHHRRRLADRGHFGPCFGVKICGPLAALSAGPDLQPPGDRSGSLDFGRLGRQIGVRVDPGL